MNVMTEDEGVEIDSLVGHGGIFATPVVAQRILAAAFNTPIRVMTTASEGGAWGMAVLADYLRHADLTLADYLDDVVFAGAESVTEAPRPGRCGWIPAILRQIRQGVAGGAQCR